eukprot:TRINITY_DN2502_c0_g4_i1.p1 TRINITY_DN2502_c0_g4~~TRINITY_DN2502_c0_g4_i1.p1  ORF type:complete len:188 (+),score=14.11 TRINITY_DN2502_c0_g4_i1:59-622(+)
MEGMGYDIAIFQSREAAQFYICIVCKKVVENPMFVGDCEHFVCGGDCLNGIQQCPHNGCNENFRSRKPNPGFLRLYNALPVRCGHCNEWNGVLGELSTHHNSCARFPVPCENQGCQQKRNREDMNRLHSHLCKQKIDLCPHCRVTVATSSLNEHLKRCERDAVLCNHLGCNGRVTPNGLAAHQKYEV